MKTLEEIETDRDTAFFAYWSKEVERCADYRGISKDEARYNMKKAEHHAGRAFDAAWTACRAEYGNPLEKQTGREIALTIVTFCAIALVVGGVVGAIFF